VCVVGLQSTCPVYSCVQEHPMVVSRACSQPGATIRVSHQDQMISTQPSCAAVFERAVFEQLRPVVEALHT
jgi:hypothetical protein